MTSAFSSSDTAVLERQADLIDVEQDISLEQIWGDAQRENCIEWIKKNNYKRVCLQFPDNYLKCSETIAASIRQAFSLADEVKTFILADTSYGSCCVDEIAAAHVDADSLVHFGNACRSKVSRLPVLYLYPQFDIDMQKFYEYLKSFIEHSTSHVVTVYLDIGYHQLLNEPINDDLKEKLINLKTKRLDLVTYCGDKFATITEDGQFAITSQGDYTKEVDEMNAERICLFIGSDNQRFFNLSLTTKAGKWFIYDVASGTGREKNPLTANYIRRRYFYIEKCKDAQTLGLIVATLTSNGYLDVVKHLQTMAKARGIKTQIISVGRINPAKLANFLEIDCFVLIGCPFNNMFESKEFYKPIVSVFEAEMALNPAWHMRYPESYVTDFKDLLPEGRSFLEFNANDINPEDVSLLTGRMRFNGTSNGNDVEAANLSALSEQQQAIATQARMEVMTTNTGLTFEDRTWRGLDPALGQTEPAKIEKGLSGISIRYTHD
ncbi:2-(3-amino-3-carboxypropyl)histidine synthase subunit 2 [Musca vetustissima]|uniref:2-(3-amino-3-carboxypropyl)histidine synthase subunit 2 n=1 Tax=Musca vetustissima TaxID=27455 RepID=UPI002AB7B096|nr:2-(3-amino-3-carboxypropyl)histidine synthase subunit 2 [Musca vetustissima]